MAGLYTWLGGRPPHPDVGMEVSLRGQGGVGINPVERAVRMRGIEQSRHVQHAAVEVVLPVLGRGRDPVWGQGRPLEVVEEDSLCDRRARRNVDCQHYGRGASHHCSHLTFNASWAHVRQCTTEPTGLQGTRHPFPELISSLRMYSCGTRARGRANAPQPRPPSAPKVRTTAIARPRRRMPYQHLRPESEFRRIRRATGQTVMLTQQNGSRRRSAGSPPAPASRSRLFALTACALVCARSVCRTGFR
jgi:hypothetical protein